MGWEWAPRRWRRALLSLGAALLLGGALLSLGVAFFEWRRRGVARAVSLEIEAAERAALPAPWERAVLRGAAVPGNATTDADEALRVLDLGTIEVLGLSEVDALRLATERAPELERLRRSTQRSWALRPSSPLESQEEVKDRGRIRARASRLLSMLARASPPAECMRRSADLVRLGQDAMAGATFDEVLSGALVVRDGARTSALAGCEARASRSELLAAAQEMGFLAANPPPVGPSLARHAADLSRRALDGASFAGGFSGWLSQATATGAAESFLSEIPGWIAVGALSSRSELEQGRGVLQARARSTNPLVLGAAARPAVLSLELVTNAQAYVRIAAVLLEAHLIERDTGSLPATLPAAGEAPHLRDPFSGLPLRWALEPTSIQVRSVGPNGVDDLGAKDTDDPWIRLARTPSAAAEDDSPGDVP